MPVKIGLEYFVKILEEKNLEINDIKDILRKIGIEESKIDKLVTNIKNEKVDTETKKEILSEEQSIINLEKEIISLNFDLSNLKTVFDSYKKKVNDIEKKVNDIEKKVLNLLSLIEENIPNLISKK